MYINIPDITHIIFLNYIAKCSGFHIIKKMLGRPSNIAVLSISMYKGSERTIRTVPKG